MRSSSRPTLRQALQTIVSRNVDPLKAAVLSITQIHAGSGLQRDPGDAKLVRHRARVLRTASAR